MELFKTNFKETTLVFFIRHVINLYPKFAFRNMNDFVMLCLWLNPILLIWRQPETSKLVTKWPHRLIIVGYLHWHFGNNVVHDYKLFLRPDEWQSQFIFIKETHVINCNHVKFIYLAFNAGNSSSWPPIDILKCSIILALCPVLSRVASSRYF